MSTTAGNWVREHPFLVALVVLLIVVTPGFIRTEQAINRAEHALSQLEDQAERNSIVISCVTDWVKAETEALQERDAVTRTSRSAALDLWRTLAEFIERPPSDARAQTLESIRIYRVTLRRLDRAVEVTPYPEIEECLDGAKTPASVEQLIHLISLTTPPRCLGYNVTIRGSRKDDILWGTNRRDVIRGFGGNDLIVAFDGNDVLCGNGGDDTLNGSRGRDRGRGGRGADICTQVEREKSC